MSTGRLLHFNTLKTRAAGRVTGLMVEFIKQLRANFASRLEDFSVPRDLIGPRVKGYYLGLGVDEL